MAAKGYTTPEDVAAYMGAVLTAPQLTLVDIAIESAENWIDYEIKHAWLETGPITETFIQPVGLYLRVLKPPIVSIDAVWLTPWPGADAQPVDELCGGWMVQSLRDGTLVVPYAHHGYSVTVEYTPNNDAVPADIRMATMALASSYMRLMPTLSDGVDPSVIQSYEVGGELVVTFRKNLLAGGVVPQTVTQFLSRWVKGYSIV